jgi:hypothetical protein
MWFQTVRFGFSPTVNVDGDNTSRIKSRQGVKNSLGAAGISTGEFWPNHRVSPKSTAFDNVNVELSGLFVGLLNPRLFSRKNRQ